MSDQITLNPLRAVNANGLPVALAQAFPLLPGTTTPTTVFTSSALTTPHPTPIVANGSGVFPPIWVATGTLVKIDVRDPVTGNSLPGFPLDPAFTISTAVTAAGSVTFSPITGVLENNVQSAIARVQANINDPRFVGSLQSITDLNNVTAAGVYYADPTALNSPLAAEGRGMYVQHFPQGTNYSAQIGWRDTLNGSEIWGRQRQGGSYSAWRRIAAGDQSTALAATGTSVEFTNIPDWATNLVVNLHDIAMSDPARIQVQLRQASLGVVTSGYSANGAQSSMTSASGNVEATVTGSIELRTDGGTGSRIVNGEIRLRRLTDSNLWAFAGEGSRSNTLAVWATYGSVTLTNRISGIRFTAASGTFTGGNFYWRAF